jgi:hypothetical protein
MSDLEKRLTEGLREHLKAMYPAPVYRRMETEETWNACAAIAREVVAEKDAEIARLRSGLDTLGKTVGERAEVVGRRSFDSPTAPDFEDDEIARLEAILSGFGYQHKLDVSTGERVWFKCVIAQPRKVTDAQREAAFIAEGNIVRRNGPVS